MSIKNIYFATLVLTVNLILNGCEDATALNTPTNKDVSSNKAPTVIINGDTTYVSNNTVTLDASSSFDPDNGDKLSFTWKQTSGVAVTLSSNSESILQFQAPNVNETSNIVFDLIVSDGIDTTTKSVSLTITPVSEEVSPNDEAEQDNPADDTNDEAEQDNPVDDEDDNTQTYNLGATTQETIDTCMDVNDKEMITLINNARANARNCGDTNYPAAPALAWNCKLDSAATMHSTSMADNDYFSHTGIDGSSPGDRISAADYQWRAYGENIASGYSDTESVMQGWLDSPGHCSNIMSTNFTEVGAGSALGGSYGIYWTQDFATPQ